MQNKDLLRIDALITDVSVENIDYTVDELLKNGTESSPRNRIIMEVIFHGINSRPKETDIFKQLIQKIIGKASHLQKYLQLFLNSLKPIPLYAYVIRKLILEGDVKVDILRKMPLRPEIGFFIDLIKPEFYETEEKYKNFEKYCDTNLPEFVESHHRKSFDEDVKNCGRIF